MPALLFETLTAYRKTAALKAAFDLDLFTAVGSHSVRAQQLAQHCGASERGIRILCDYLTVLTFLTKDSSGRYALAEDTARFMAPDAPISAHDAAAFLLARSTRAIYDQLTEAVRRGGTAASAYGTLAPEHPIWLHFARGMSPTRWQQAEALAELVLLDPGVPSKVLDIAASLGAYGMAFARKYPTASIVALDWQARRCRRARECGACRCG